MLVISAMVVDPTGPQHAANARICVYTTYTDGLTKVKLSSTKVYAELEVLVTDRLEGVDISGDQYMTLTVGMPS